MNPRLLLPCAAVLAAALVGACAALGQAKKPAPKPASAPKPATTAAKPAAPAPKPAAAPPQSPASSAPAAQPPTGLISAALGPALKDLGLEPKAEGPFQRIKIEEEDFGYTMDFGISKSGEWLVGVARLAPIPDLTKVPSAPLLSLLSANDSLLGMYFSYDRATSQIVLNAAVPARATRRDDLKVIVEGMRGTIRETQGLWDPAAW